MVGIAVGVMVGGAAVDVKVGTTSGPVVAIGVGSGGWFIVGNRKLVTPNTTPIRSSTTPASSTLRP